MGCCTTKQGICNTSCGNIFTKFSINTQRKARVAPLNKITNEPIKSPNRFTLHKVDRSEARVVPSELLDVSPKSDSNKGFDLTFSTCTCNRGEDTLQGSYERHSCYDRFGCLVAPITPVRKQKDKEMSFCNSSLIITPPDDTNSTGCVNDTAHHKSSSVSIPEALLNDPTLITGNMMKNAMKITDDDMMIFNSIDKNSRQIVRSSWFTITNEIRESTSGDGTSPRVNFGVNRRSGVLKLPNCESRLLVFNNKFFDTLNETSDKPLRDFRIQANILKHLIELMTTNDNIKFGRSLYRLRRSVKKNILTSAMVERVHISIMHALETSLKDDFTDNVANAWSSVCSSILEAVLQHQTSQVS
ncbi:hypothetical protein YASMINEVIRUS_1408 [Yasminevirus sp. GU-2018]|uniref:Uncharacterized protein n=1 Tax=Yasminevirus sp. GU-2018 TaxID=2420051 RepID=A0A5K0UC55_9VIRU|nr:hypothetical protein YASMINEVIRUS_1408 [Yasminevirus sp. GU-2018]